MFFFFKPNIQAHLCSNTAELVCSTMFWTLYFFGTGSLVFTTTTTTDKQLVCRIYAMSENSTEMRLKIRIPAMMVLAKLQIKWPLPSGSWINIGKSVQVHWNQTTRPPKMLPFAWKQTSLVAHGHLSKTVRTYLISELYTLDRMNSFLVTLTMTIQLCCQPEPLGWWI